MSGLWMPMPAQRENETGAATSNIRAPGARNTSGELDRDAFLMLLITQMQHQDPLNPMDDRDFLAQMAQFSALEQQQQMTRAMERHQAHGMIGKDVYAHFFCETTEQFREVQGPVVYVTTRGGNVILGVETMVPRQDEEGRFVYTEAGDRMYELRVVDTPLDRVSWVSDENFMSRQLQGILDGVANSRDLGLIGQTVQAVLLDENGRMSEFIEGRVDFVRFVDGISVLMVNGREITAGQVMSVSGESLVMDRHIRGAFVNQNGQMQTAQGYIRGIEMRNNRAYVELDNGTRVPLNAIGELIEGLRFVGENVAIATADYDFAGRVEWLSVTNGEVRLHISSTQFLSLRRFLEVGGRMTNVVQSTPPPADDDDDDSLTN